MDVWTKEDRKKPTRSVLKAIEYEKSEYPQCLTSSMIPPGPAHQSQRRTDPLLMFQIM